MSKINFGSNITTSFNHKDVEQLKGLQDRTNQIVREIGADSPQKWGEAASIDNNVASAQERIKKLRNETIKAWSGCPEVLQQKLKKLDKYDKELKRITDRSQKSFQRIDITPRELIMPEQQEKLVLDPLTVRAMYSSIVTKNLIRKLRLPSINIDCVDKKEVENSLSDLNEKNWNFFISF